jgi:hypothetical protein
MAMRGRAISPGWPHRFYPRMNSEAQRIGRIRGTSGVNDVLRSVVSAASWFTKMAMIVSAFFIWFSVQIGLARNQRQSKRGHGLQIQTALTWA